MLKGRNEILEWQSDFALNIAYTLAYFFDFRNVKRTLKMQNTMQQNNYENVPRNNEYRDTLT